MALPALIRRPLEMLGALAPLPITPGPIREGSPESDDALPVGDLVSRDGFIPTGWLKGLADNSDTILARDGNGLALYDQLLDDDQVFSACQQRRLAITSRDFEVAAGDKNDPRSVQAANDFRAMLEGLGFDRVTGLMWYAVWYGYGVGEAIYSIRERNGRSIVWLDDIIVPDRRWFGFTNEGELRLTNVLGSGIDGEALPENKFWTVRTGATHDFAFYGLGLAHWVYWLVFFKRSGLKFWALYLEKLGMPTVAMEFTPAQDNRDDKAKLLAAGMSIGQDRAVLVPEGTLQNDRLKLIEATRSGAGTSSYEQFVNLMDEGIMRVVLGQPGTSKGVSDGLNGQQAKVHQGVKDEIVKADSDLQSETFCRTIPKWITRWNYGPDVAPPKVRRILDDPEDLDVTADRDVKLAGIGVKRTKQSVGEVYGPGYEVDRLTEEQKTANATALAQAKASAIGAAAGGAVAANDNGMVAARKRIAEFAAAFEVDDRAPLYVSRKLLNADEVLAWAKDQGFTTTVPAADLHVTVLYSKTPVDWFGMGDDWSSDRNGRLVVKEGGPRAVEAFGDGAVVLRFASPDLRWRHETMIENGASSDYDEYKPHVTISYDAAELDLSTVEPFTGELRFGPEIFEPIKTDDPLAKFKLDFSADDEDAIDRLVTALVDDTNPVFAAMADAMRTNLQGVKTAEGARVALLDAFEQIPVETIARRLAVPLLAERAGGMTGREEDVVA